MRLSRGLRRYRDLLQALGERGYEIQPLGDWVRCRREGPRTVLLRHDVDQHAPVATRMAELETDMGVKGTWYVRWRTATPELIGRLHELQLEVGLHYESLSRLGHRLRTRSTEDLDVLKPIAASYLSAEVQMFAHLFGRCPSICPHGDTRLPEARNADLLAYAGTDALKVDFDARAVMADAGRRGWAWLTDDGHARRRGMPPESDPLRHESQRMMLVIHPNNWGAVRPWNLGRPVRDDPPC